MIEENYLNEERFAIQFAGGKFRINKWGRIKIKYALQQKRVSAYNINKAIDCIEEEDYQKTLQKLASKKWKQMTSPTFVRRAGCMQYLLGKGYEKYLAKSAIDKAMLEEEA
jgi:regulatory protein